MDPLDTYAIFIDGDNITPTHYSVINDLIRKRGRIILKKVYADFSEENTKAWKKICLDFGIEAVIAWREHGKNSTDIKMTIDMMNILNNYKHIHNFVIVTGDVDFKELCAKISSEGKNVIGISCYEKSTSKTLKNFCNEFIVLDTSKAKKLAKPNNNLRANIAKVCKNILEDEPNINIGLLKSKLLNIDPSFNELNFGYNSFSEFIKTFQDDIKLVKDDYGNYWASLK
jgi:uncharacterized protein (TIGR00288 family)